MHYSYFSRNNIFKLFSTIIFIAVVTINPVNSSEQIICDVFSIEYKINKNSLCYKLVTDLPDDANVTINFSRSYKRKIKGVLFSNDENYYEDYIAINKNVGELRKYNDITLNDNLLCQNIAIKQKLSEDGIKPFQVDTIDKNIKLLIIFHTRQDESKYGINNLNVSGKMIKDNAPIKAIRVEKNILLPLTIKYDPKNIPKDFVINRTVPTEQGNSHIYSKPDNQISKADRNSNTQTRYATNGGQVACSSKSNVEDMMKFAAAKDNASFMAYITSNKCLILKDDIEVTVMESPGLFDLYYRFAYRGMSFWTTIDGIKKK